MNTTSTMTSTPSMTAGKKRRGNKTLKSWVDFVKRVQHEESISYKEAMSRAKARKSEWKHGGGDTSPDEGVPIPNEGVPMDISSSSGGRRRTRRTRKSRKSRKSRKTRHRRR
jgi:hypothetical protein